MSASIKKIDSIKQVTVYKDFQWSRPVRDEGNNIAEFTKHRVKSCNSVNRSGYYKWCNRSMNSRKQKKQLVTSAVVTAFEPFKHRYGARRIPLN